MLNRVIFTVWPLLTFGPTPKTTDVIFSTWSIYKQSTSSLTLDLLEIPRLRAVFKVSIFDLHQNQQGSFTQYTYPHEFLWSFQCGHRVHNNVHEFNSLTPGDPKWPETPPKAIGIRDRDFLLSMGYSHFTCQVWDFLSLYILRLNVYKQFKVFSMTSDDPTWPFTCTKNNRDHILTMEYLHEKYKIPVLACPPWDSLLCLRAALKAFTISPSVTSNDRWP